MDTTVSLFRVALRKVRLHCFPRFNEAPYNVILESLYCGLAGGNNGARCNVEINVSLNLCEIAFASERLESIIVQRYCLGSFIENDRRSGWDLTIEVLRTGDPCPTRRLEWL